MSKFEVEHKAKVAELNCILCGRTQTEVHHCLTGHGKTAHDLLTASLCWTWEGDGCHRDANGNAVAYSEDQDLKMLLETWVQLERRWGPEYIAEVKRRLRESRAIQRRCETRGGRGLAAMLTEG